MFFKTNGPMDETDRKFLFDLWTPQDEAHQKNMDAVWEQVRSKTRASYAALEARLVGRKVSHIEITHSSTESGMRTTYKPIFID